ncbi:MAG: ExbD/TolR family protein [Planctomycetota bacterium]
MKVKHDENESQEVQMGPLIDCVFLMLIFFIVIAVTKKSIKDLKITLPTPTANAELTKPKDRDLVIRVTEGGTIYVGSSEVNMQGLLEEIRRVSENDPDTKVRFELDRDAKVRHLMPIWDQLTHYGLTKWGMRTQMSQ